MSKNKGRAQEQQFNNDRQYYQDIASQPSEATKRSENHWINLDKWRNGELGPIDVRNMPGVGVGMSLFEQARKAHDEGRVGKGLGSLEGNADPSFAKALDSQRAMERETNAAGALENYVDSEMNNTDAGLYGAANAQTQRNQYMAGLTSQNFFNYLNRSKPMGFWKQLALGTAQGAASNAALASKI